MTSDLRELYQEMILDHYKTPRNFGALDGADRHAEGYNPLCGDRVTVHLRMDGERLGDLAFEGKGCAISTASASLMTEALKGKTVSDAEALFVRFREVVTGEAEESRNGPDLGKLSVLAGVREFPVRVKCATLAWHTLKAALADNGGTVSTE